MKEILKSKYRNFILAGLLLNILCAWYSVGFHQSDEHFQILEFCNFKLGHISAGDLAWEYQQKIRSALLPGIACLCARFLYLCGAYNPFTLAFILRFLAGVASWFIACKYCILFSTKFKTPIGEKLMVMMSMFLWFMPYINVRFTSENISAIALLLGVYYVLTCKSEQKSCYLKYAFAGLCFGFSFFIRPQMGFAIAGFIAWLLIVKKTEWKYLFVLAFSALAAIGINILIDYWFYGTWTFSPYGYYYANIVQHKAADYGVNPWWFYFTDFIIRAVPPLSLLLLVMFFSGIFRNLKDPMVWVFAPFFIFHCFMGHKEMRFLFPMAIIFTYLASAGFDYFLTKEYYQKIHRYFYAVAVIICIPLLAYRTFAPAHVSVNYFKYLYEYPKEKDQHFFILRNDDYFHLYGLNYGFYKNSSLITVPLDSMQQIEPFLKANKPQSALFLCQQTISSKDTIQGYKTKMVYCYFPDWLLKFDINKWEERTQIWRVYEFDKVE